MKFCKFLVLFLLISAGVQAQSPGLVDMTQSKYAKISNTGLGDVHWTGGFWENRFEVLKDSSIWSMWDTWNNPDVSHGFRNFEIAAGEKKGEHWGPPFHDGDFYKWLEGVASVYAVTKDPKLDALMDKVIATIAKAQREDGYIHTPVIIDELNKGVDSHKKKLTGMGMKLADENEKGAFANRLNFETYNLGHLMTAGVIHYRATGKKTLLNVAIKATNFLCHFYETASAELARNAICPSHYMGVVEMYRTTHEPRYLHLAEELIHIRDSVENGQDHNQDRIPFRQQKTAMGHAVRANYLYAGAADVYAETGEAWIKDNLESIWSDIVNRKMYITGACGALYDGVSPDGTSYEPDSIQQIHQAYGRPYQLPNSMAHNETCANIGNALFNWRMFEVTGDAKYVNIVENCLYNSIFSAISLDGTRYFYTNPLRIDKNLPYTLRWSKQRTKYISCFCCPPNALRTLCEAQDYAYTLSKEGIWCNLYGENEYTGKLLSGEAVSLKQTTDYPWNGKITLTVEKAPKNKLFTVFLRVPDWCTNATLAVNGKSNRMMLKADSYAKINREWKKGDVIELNLPMKAELIEANPLVEENRNQVAVRRGPIVYCLESEDIANGTNINDVVIPDNIQWTPVKTEIDGCPMTVLDGTAECVKENSWKGTLYRPLSEKTSQVHIRLIPYFAWGNRGQDDMTIWMPVRR